ncbi:hypothetical protein ACNKHR_27140 [Shigella flexneri]
MLGKSTDRGRWRTSYFFCNEQNEKGEPVTWQGRTVSAVSHSGSGFELSGKGTSTRPTLRFLNLYGMVTTWWTWRVWSVERWSGAAFMPVFWMR